ncbi:hypothetical protein HY992_05365 [Candidatus Micrarchaeota archaeon]|nr:hypothetical protein [Candidatus Micrarchaeota archaeon]
MAKKQLEKRKALKQTRTPNAKTTQKLRQAIKKTLKTEKRTTVFQPAPKPMQALKRTALEQQPAPQTIKPVLFKPTLALKQALEPETPAQAEQTQPAEQLRTLKQPAGAKQKLFTIIFLLCLLGISFFAVLFLTQFFTVPQAESGQQQTPKYSEPIKPLDVPNANAASCLSSHSIASSEIVEIYSPTCPRSQAMQPIINSLENQGFKFKKLDITNVQAQTIMGECLSQIISGYTPQFICAKKNTQLTGQVSQEQLKQFASNCIP